MIFITNFNSNLLKNFCLEQLLYLLLNCMYNNKNLIQLLFIDLINLYNKVCSDLLLFLQNFLLKN